MRTYQARAVALDSTLVIITAVGLERLRLALDDSFVPVRYPSIQILIIVAIWSSAMWIEGAYNKRILGSGIQEFKTVTSASFKGFLLVCFVALAANQHPPRINLFVGWFCSVVLVALGRKLLQVRMHAERRAGKLMRNVLILGSTEYAVAVTSLLATETHLGMRALGHIPLHTPESHLREEAWLETVDQSIRDAGVKVLIVEDSQGANANLLSKLSWHLNNHEIDMLVAPTFLNQFGPRLEFESHAALPLVYLDEPELTLGERIMKRTMDLVLASLAVLILLPFMLLISMGVFISSPGPILFIQDRVGLAGSLFRFIKFRTMVVGAENMRQDILGTPDEAMADRYKNDPRIYPFGRILRRLSLDELPQLFTVIRGKMSLVGPRPLLIEELDLLGDEDHRRHLTKPGLTGLWQINGRKETTWDERIQLDLRYVHNWSLGLDIGIIIKTIKVVLTGHGSY